MSKVKQGSKVNKGIVVHIGEKAFMFPLATGWGLGQDGILAIGEPGNKVNEGGVPINDTIAAFKIWDRVGYIDKLT